MENDDGGLGMRPLFLHNQQEAYLPFRMWTQLECEVMHHRSGKLFLQGHDAKQFSLLWPKV
jgi:hypothetical protein